jgi:hypothetical protein
METDPNGIAKIQALGYNGIKIEKEGVYKE